LSLQISPRLSLPLEAATWVLSYVAKRGAGKTYDAAVQAEEMLKARIPVVVVDGMGIWWGLRVSADGEHAGLPVVVFGGEHADLPLVPEKAAEMAKAIVESNISCVLDLSVFSHHISRKIVSAFLNELYRLNRVERHVFIEESDMFAPQKPLGDETVCLGAVDNFVRRGGNHNLGCTLITQRSAVLNKDILTQSDCLIVLRTLAPQDKKAIQAWVEEQTDEDKEELKKWYDSLKSLENGEAWVWHPEKPVIFEKVTFRQRETFHATREFIKSPRANRIVLMGVDEFIERFKKVFRSESTALQTSIGAPRTLDPDVVKELEEYRSGHKLAESVQKRLTFLGERVEELSGMEAKSRDQLEDAHQKLKKFENLQKALAEIMPAAAAITTSTPGAVPNMPGISVADVDERINQRLSQGPGPIPVVSVDVDQRIKDLVKNEVINGLVAKIKTLPDMAKKAAWWLHEKKEATVKEVFNYVYNKSETAGRVPGNFYANVINPLEDAWLIINKDGNVRWVLQEKLATELKEVLSNSDLEKVPKYLASLLL